MYFDISKLCISAWTTGASKFAGAPLPQWKRGTLREGKKKEKNIATKQNKRTTKQGGVRVPGGVTAGQERRSPACTQRRSFQLQQQQEPVVQCLSAAPRFCCSTVPMNY